MRVKWLVVKNLGLFILFSLITSVSAASEKLDFFAIPKMTSAIISPDGIHIATMVNDKDSQQLQLRKRGSKASEILLNLSEFTPDNAHISGITWLDNQNISAQFVELKKGVEDLLDTKAIRFLLVIQIPSKKNAQPIIKSVRTNGWLVDPLVDEADAFLYAKSGIYSKVYRIQPSLLSPHKIRLGKLHKKDGGQFKKKNEVVSVEGFAIRWFFDTQGEVKAVLNYIREGGLTLNSINEQGEATKIHNWTDDESDDNRQKTQQERRILPVAIAQEPDTFYCLDFAEDEERSVYKVNYKTGSEELIYESDSHQIVSLIMADRSSQLVGVKVLKNGRVQNMFIDANSVEANANKKSHNGELLTARISESSDKQFSVEYLESHRQPGQFYLVNQSNQKRQLLGSLFPHLDNQLKTRQIESSVMVEGLSIPYILNLPKTNNKPASPLIVMPHGGPIGVFDSRYFDAASQYLNASGFAVLRVNYRGSSGYSFELKEAGKREWGNLILKDIVAATNAVATRSEIDSDQICIMGMSYGGYAAAMLTIQHPEIFKCGVDVAGVSDVNLYLNSPYRTERQDIWLKEYVGDTVGEYDLNKKISPIYLVKDLKRPLLIMHGAKDDVVDVEHAFRLKLMLEKYHKPFEWKIFEEAGHSMETPEFSHALFNTAVDFIQRQL